MKWSRIKAASMAILGLNAFALKDGKLDVTEEQRTKLAESFGDKFPVALEKHLASEEASNEDAEMASDDAKGVIATLMQEIKTNLVAENERFKTELSAAKQKIEAQKLTIETLAADPEPDQLPHNEPNAKTMSTFRPNMKLYHNRAWEAHSTGLPLPQAADPTIEVSDLKSEFGVYIDRNTREIVKTMMTATETEKHMRTVLTDDSEWRASQANMDSIVQQMVHKWTPLGKATFTPLTIKARAHKINVPITPGEVIDSWLGFMYDESLQPKDMPITRYIIQELIVPKVQDDMELLLIGKGEFVEISVTPADGDAGQATGKSMDGLHTILIKEYENASTAINFVALGVLTSANIVDKMNVFADSLPETLASKPMETLTSLDMYRMYKRAYQEIYPVTKEGDATKDIIDFSMLKLTHLPSLNGLMTLIATPKDNLICLRSRNDGANRIWMQADNYDVKVFAEWKKSVGFAIADMVTAYVNPIYVINRYAVGNDASKLLIKMLTDAGAEDVNAAKLAGYKTAIAAATGIADLAALQTIIDTVNAA